MENEVKEVEIEIKKATEEATAPKDDQSVALQKLKELGELKEKGVNLCTGIHCHEKADQRRI
ncbi:hypothetical protein D5R40_33860 [Okeania hirsuta]|uniref:Uncharacterized protein n=1 Tax=Okeania hirsuta TaxID=1458930 RepID=A0A3N6NJB9_9CYAN|nr:hypothetical protein [Okeania hirsuta]RQH16678.1 hypothetical protein D5R40_33860 [Okeania hirsuta]